METDVAMDMDSVMEYFELSMGRYVQGVQE